MLFSAFQTREYPKNQKSETELSDGCLGSFGTLLAIRMSIEE